MRSEEWIEVNAHVDIACVVNPAAGDDAVDRYIAEIYDRHETQCADVALIQSIIQDKKVKRLELFCEHDRILVLPAEVGYEIIG